jgi:hypothetical protein
MLSSRGNVNIRRVLALAVRKMRQSSRQALGYLSLRRWRNNVLCRRARPIVFIDAAPVAGSTCCAGEPAQLPRPD